MSRWIGRRRRGVDAAQRGRRRGRPADDRGLRGRRSGAERQLRGGGVPAAARPPARTHRSALRFAHDLAGRRALPRAALDVLREAAAARSAADGCLAHGRAAAQPRPRRGSARGRDDRDRVVPDHRRHATGGCATATRRCRSARTSRTPLTTCISCSAREPSAERARALETYLNTVCDHGLNASTFAARVIVSTRSDVISAITGAVGALKGPLHGGAPGPALDMVFEIGTPERAEAVIRARLDRGERLMGFGHRVYRVRDPRADVLAAGGRALLRERRRSVALRSRAARRGDGAAPAARAEARSAARHQRRVLHRAAAARPRPAAGTVHADVCGRPGRSAGRRTASSSFATAG